MAVDGQRRHELYLAFEEVVGREAAATTMEHLPAVGWSGVARRSDIEHLTAITRSELETATAQLRAEAANTNAELRKEIAANTAELRKDIAGLGTEIAGVRTEIAESGRKALVWVVGPFSVFYATLLAAILTTR